MNQARWPIRWTTVWTLLLLGAGLAAGCGNSEAPKIRDVKLFYWDYDAGEEGPTWKGFATGDTIPYAPIRIEGSITDNTAVVDPVLSVFAEREDVDETGFKACTRGEGEYFECTLDCRETQAGRFECDPALRGRDLIRGDRFRVTATTAEGETFEVEIAVTEAQDLALPADESAPVQINRDYRILRVKSVEGDPNPFLWTLFYATAANPQEKDWRPLRTGELLELETGDPRFRLRIDVPEGMELNGTPEATWKSLVKWNGSIPIYVDPRDGAFAEELDLFDPRETGEVVAQGTAPTYRLRLSAYDVPDQKEDEGRYSEETYFFTFLPPVESRPPEISLDLAEEDSEGEIPEVQEIETEATSQIIEGTVESFAGEVKALAFVLSDGDRDDGERIYYVNTDNINLQGEFSVVIQLVSDWDGDGVIDRGVNDEPVPNLLEIAALDVQGNWSWARPALLFQFSPPGPEVYDLPPVMETVEIYPELGSDNEVTVPLGEAMKLRIRSSDDRGATRFSRWDCVCEGDLPLVNEDRCPCSFVEGGDTNPLGETPCLPWEWISVESAASDTRERVTVLQAREKEEEGQAGEAAFAAIEVVQVASDDGEGSRMTVSPVETEGPYVSLFSPVNGMVVDPDNFVIHGSVISVASALNRVVALLNGQPWGEPVYDDATGGFTWDLSAVGVQEGDSVCVGAISVSGHATLYVLDFAEASEGLLVGITYTTDPDQCK